MGRVQRVFPPRPGGGELVPPSGVQRLEDARTSHPCELGAGHRKKETPPEAGADKTLLAARRPNSWRCVVSGKVEGSRAEALGSLSQSMAGEDEEHRARREASRSW